MRMLRTLALPLFSALLGLAACKARPATTAHDLMLTSQDFAAIASIETVFEAVDDPQAEAGAANQDLRQQHIRSAGRYRYHLSPPDGGVYKVHILLFADAAAARDNWLRRHHPQALATTTRLPLGAALQGKAEAWIYPSAERGEMASTLAGRAVIEIQARGAASRLAPFTAAIAGRAVERVSR